MSVRTGASRAYNELQRATAAHAARAVKEQRATDRARLAELRATLRAHAAKRGERVRALRRLTRDTLTRLRAKVRELRTSLRTASTAARELARYVAPGARVVLGASSAAALRELAAEHEGLTATVSAEEAELHEREKERRELAKAEGRGRAKDRPKATRVELRHESDESVEVNLPREIVPAWRKFKGRVKAGPRSSRTEAFLEWAHDHGADVERAQQEADEDISSYVAEERELSRQFKRAGGSR